MQSSPLSPPSVPPPSQYPPCRHLSCIFIAPSTIALKTCLQHCRFHLVPPLLWLIVVWLSHPHSSAAITASFCACRLPPPLPLLADCCFSPLPSPLSLLLSSAVALSHLTSHPWHWRHRDPPHHLHCRMSCSCCPLRLRSWLMYQSNGKVGNA